MSDQPNTSFIDDIIAALDFKSFDNFALRMGSDEAGPQEVMLTVPSTIPEQRKISDVKKEVMGILESMQGDVQLDVLQKAPAFSEAGVGNSKFDKVIASFEVQQEEEAPDFVVTTQDAEL